LDAAGEKRHAAIGVDPHRRRRDRVRPAAVLHRAREPDSAPALPRAAPVDRRSGLRERVGHVAVHRRVAGGVFLAALPETLLTAVLSRTVTACRVIVSALSESVSASLTGRRTRAASAAASGSIFV